MSEALSKRRLVLRVATIGAWVFAVGSLAILLYVVWRHWPGTESETQIMGGMGLRYVGIAGTVLAVFQAAVLLAAIVMSVLPRRVPRRIGHGLLIAWCALWLVNGISAAQADGDILMWVLVVPLLAFVMACTAVRAARGWSPRSPG